MRPSGSPEALEQRRLRAVELFKEGFGPTEIARRIKVERRSVRRWKSTYLAHGPEALKARPNPGRPSKLDPRAKRSLEKILLRGARASGFSTDLWTCPRVAQVIKKEFGVGYHVDHICRLLHALGWSPQKPERRAVERDEEAIQTWVKTEWPRVKKTPRG